MQQNNESTAASNTSPDIYLAIVCDLEHFAAVEQAEICHYLADQIDHFAQSSCDGYLGTVNFVSGFLEFSVHCKDPDQALSDFVSKLESGEIDIPEDDDDIRVVRYAKVCDADPVLVLLDLIEQFNDEDWICDDCLKAMKEEEGALAEKIAKH